MLNVIKKAMKIAILFFFLYICSFCVVQIFLLLGATFTNVSNTTFIAALFSTLVLFLFCVIGKNRNVKKEKRGCEDE